MPSQRVRRFIVAGLVACLGVVLWAKAGDLNPPAGPVAPTMKTLDQLSAEHAQLASAIAGISGGGGIKQVVHGRIDLASGVFEGEATISPDINPSKSVVTLSDAVIVNTAGTYTNTLGARNGACLMDLTASVIKVRVDETGASGIRRVSYQIIEYN
jgi:hypothetical protein